MTSKDDQSVEELITCTVCYNTFDDPRRLACSHTYCRKCIIDRASVNEGRFSCPRDECIVAEHEIDSLPVNLHIFHLVGVHRK